MHETYHHLGDAANGIARYLRRQGVGAHAGHPLNGLVLYPPLAQQAGLGWRVKHGILTLFFYPPHVHYWLGPVCVHL